MKPLKILIDPCYPDELVNSLKAIHDLQEEKKFEIHSWCDGIENKFSLSDSVFLAVNHSKKSLSEVIIKQMEEGYRLFVMKLESDLDYFEFAMTVFRLWPFIVEKSEMNREKRFCYTFNYGGRKLYHLKRLTNS
ncbi:hypothetical protein MM239_17035 [Belliella sp. DSM 111904]|uniref:VapC45 PIN like domain-containing protein n=1 Tax=Belliella filtrata TaxID=2923435 RepID=A0ABS9V3W7_9BACT|nr:hypothetical protein [Belliella filtrata]MCH7411112.1 hypothetical protein [Belliella filtrata]